MNDILNELITDIVLLGEAVKKPKAKPQKDKKPPNAKVSRGGKWYTADPTSGGEYVGRYEGPKWIDATPEEKAQEKQKSSGAERIGSTGSDAELDRKKQQVSAALRGQRPSILPLSPKAQQAGLGKIHDEFDKLLQSGDAAALTKFMETHGIVFDDRKNTFYVYSVKGREQKKIFGDGSKSAKGLQQKELFDKLREMGVDVQLRDTYTDPLKPAGVIPKDQQKEFDGKRDGDTIVFNGHRYDLIPEGKFPAYITQQTSSWIKKFKETNGRKPTKKEINEASRQFVILANAMNDRYRMLQKLMQRSAKNKEPHTIALFEGEEGAKQYIDNVRQSLLQRVPEEDTKLRSEVESKLNAIENAQGDDQSIAALVDLYRLIETSDTFVSSASSVAESLSIMLELKRGRQVIVPISDNFKAADLITLSSDDGVDPTTLSLEELTDRVKVVYSSVSVKREEGAASSMQEKFKMSVFAPRQKQTLSQLIELSSGHAELFSENKDIRRKKESIVESIIMGNDSEPNNIQIIKKYFNLPPNTSFDDLLEILGTGGVVCVNGKTVARPTPDYMQRDGVDKRAYKYTHAMQLCAEAIANTKVIAQGFGNHFWGGKAGFIEVDGINNQVKQVIEPNKDQRLRTPKGSTTPTQMPDYLVSHNVIPTSEQDLRSGNPC